MQKKNELKKTVCALPRLFFGFVLCAIGISTLLSAHIGLDPWGTLTVGLENLTGLTFGRLSQIIGLSIIVLTIPMKLLPGIGTILNMIFIGLFIDIIQSLNIIPITDNLLLSIIELVIGLIILSFGVYIYISCGLGAGPRDGLMLALIKITGLKATIIKPAIDITVLIIGILLGGPLGIGTVIVAIFNGRFFDIVFKLFNYDPKTTEHQTIIDFAKAFVPSAS